MPSLEDLFDFSEFDALGRALGIRKSDEEFEWIAEQNHAYFAPSDEPLQWRDEVRNKLVRLDVAIMAVHVYSARASFRGISKVMGGIVSNIERQIGEWLSSPLLTKIFGSGISSLVGGFVTVAESANGIRLQRAVEAQIRAESLRAQRELKAFALGPSKRRKRKVRLVFSRHKTPRQREANKSWQPT